MKERIYAQIEDGVFKMPLWSLLEELEPEERRELARSLIWHKEVLEEFVDGLATDVVITSTFESNVYHLRRRILERTGEIERSHFRSLMFELEAMRIDMDHWRKQYWKLYHAVEDLGHLPRLEGHVRRTGWPTDEEVDAEMERRKGDADQV